MSKFEESNFYKALQDFFINADKKTFLQFLAEFYNRTEGIIDKDNIQDDLIKELRELYLEFNEKGIDDNVVREKVNYFLENNVKIKHILEKLDTKTDYYVTSSEFKAIGDCNDVSGTGTDNTIMFTNLMTQKNIRIPKGKFLITDTINITGNIIIEGSGIYETMLIFNNEDTMKSMFEKTDSSISFLTIRNITIKTLNNNKIFNLNSSCNIDFERVYLIGKNKQGVGIEIKESDFVRIEHLKLAQLDKGLVFKEDDKTAKSSTQIYVKNINGSNINIGVESRGLEKALFEGVDFMEVNTGFVFNGNNDRVELNKCHVESFYEKGIVIENKSNHLTLNDCSIILPKPSSTHGIHENYNGDKNSIKLNNTFIAENTSNSDYKQLIFNGIMEYKAKNFIKGNWRSWLDSEDTQQPFRCVTNQNIITLDYTPKKIGDIDFSDLDSLTKNNIVSVTSTDLNGFNKLDVNCNSDSSICKTFNLKKGIHTVIVEAEDLYTTGLRSAKVFIRQLFNPYKYIYNASPRNLDYKGLIFEYYANQENRVQKKIIPFYVEVEGNYSIGITFDGSGSGKALIGKFVVYQGIANDFVVNDSISITNKLVSQTFTPEIKATVTNGEHIYSTNNGNYNHIPELKMINFDIYINCTIDNTIDGEIQIALPTGIPVAKNNVACNIAFLKGFYDGKMICANIPAGMKNIKLTQTDTTGVRSYIQGTDIRGKTIGLMISGTYFY